MANPLKGEVSFEAGGKIYSVRFTTNAICSMEADLGLSLGAANEQITRGNVTTLRAALQIALGGNMTIEDVGDLIDEVGVARAVKIFSDALARAFAPAEKGARPPKGSEAGIGKNS